MKSYDIRIIAKDPINVTITNCTLRNVFLEMDGSQVSLHLQNSRFTEAGITVKGNGRKIHEAVYIVNCTFEGEIHKEAIEIKNVNVSLISNTFLNLRSKPKLAAVSCKTSQMEIENCLFANSSITSVLNMETCNVTISGTTVSNNRLEFGYLGIGLVTAKHSNIRMSGSYFDDNDASNHQVWFATKETILQFETTTISMDNCYFTGNYATHAKHVVSLEYGSTGSITNSRFFENKGEHISSAVHVSEGATASIENTEFNANGNFQYRDSQYYVLFACTGGNIAMTNVTVSNNTGLLMLLRPCHITVSSSRFNGNDFRTFDLPHSSVAETLLTIENCLFRENKIGGIIAMGKYTHSVITNSKYENNYQHEQRHFRNPPLLSVLNGRMALKHTVFVGNVLGVNSGIIKCNDQGNLSLLHVEMTDNVGRIINSFSCIIDITKSNFTNNKVKRSLFLNPFGITLTNLTISNSNFQKNSAEDGGCFYISSNSIVNITRCNFLDNFSSKGSGGVFYMENNSLFVTFSCFQGNHADKKGGVIRATNQMASFLHCNFMNNQAITGGVASISQSSMEFRDSAMVSNTVSENGGALFLEKSLLVLDRVRFENNTALLNGGSIFSTFSRSVSNTLSTIRMHNTWGIGNNAGRIGGFILITKRSELIAYNLKLARNHAEMAGSDIAIVNNSRATIELFCMYSISKKDICAIVVQRSSTLTLTTLYVGNVSEIENSMKMNETKELLPAGDLICPDPECQVSKFSRGNYLSIVIKTYSRMAVKILIFSFGDGFVRKS